MRCILFSTELKVWFLFPCELNPIWRKTPQALRVGGFLPQKAAGVSWTWQASILPPLYSVRCLNLSVKCRVSNLTNGLRPGELFYFLSLRRGTWRRVTVWSGLATQCQKYEVKMGCLSKNVELKLLFGVCLRRKSWILNEGENIWKLFNFIHLLWGLYFVHFQRTMRFSIIYSRNYKILILFFRMLFHNFDIRERKNSIII